MPINSRDKRASLMGNSLDALIVLPSPGTHEQGDRQQVSGSYRGILAAVSVLVSIVDLTVQARNRVLTVLARTGMFEPPL